MYTQGRGLSAKTTSDTRMPRSGGPGKIGRKALGIVAAIVLLLIASFMYFFFFSPAPSAKRTEATISIDALGIRFTQNESLMQYGGLVWASPPAADPPIVFYSTPALNKLGETCDPALVASGDVRGRWVGAIEKLPASVNPDPSAKIIKRIGDFNIVSVKGFDLCVPYNDADMEVTTQKAVEESLQSVNAE
jgi:hypothetical protein